MPSGGKWGQTTFRKHSENVVCPRYLSTAVEFVPKWTRNSSGQIDAFTSPAEAIKMLEVNGYSRTFSQDGKVSILTKGDRTYRFYPESTSTKEPTASLDIAGIKKTIVKIRFKGN